MNVVPFSGGRGPSDTARLPIIDTATWIGRNPPERRFIVDGWLARGTAALLVGEDGISKSLLAQQLATCVAAGRPFLGMPVERAAAIYITCEDDADELWRRQRGINAALSLPTECAPAMLSSLVGQMDVDLSAITPAGAIGPSPLARAIVDVAKEYRAGLIILDNLAHLFSGNENVRRDVAVFCSLLERMAIDADATVLLLGHPSKGGAEYSGSTGWSAHVRQRWFLERPEAGSMGVDRDARVLRKSKANYSASGTEVAFRWHEWAFVTEDQIPPENRMDVSVSARAAVENEAFLRCLDASTEKRRAVSHNQGVNYAPKVFAAMTEGKGFNEAAFKHAFERLLYLGAIELDQALWQRENRAWKYGIKRAEKRAPICTHLPLYINIYPGRLIPPRII